MSTPLHDQIKIRFQLGPPSHMTLIDNLNSILHDGCLKSKNSLVSNSYHDLSNASVQSIRVNKINCASGLPLHDYVPLYFGVKTPMVSSLRAQNETLVFLRFSFELLNSGGVTFTDGNAASSGTTFYSFVDIGSLEVLDVTSILATSWTHDAEIKRKKQSELLVPTRLDLSYLVDIICFSESAKSSIEGALKVHGIECEVHILKNSWYFIS